MRRFLLDIALDGNELAALLCHDLRALGGVALGAARHNGSLLRGVGALGRAGGLFWEEGV